MKRSGLCVVAFIIMLLNGHAQTGLLPAFRVSYSPPETSFRGFTKGSRYLFDSAWVKGFVLSANNSVIRNDSFLLNFDKMTQNLLVTVDFKTFIEVNKKEFKSVTFFVHDSAYIFEHVYLIDNNKLYVPIIKTEDQYSLFKLIHTNLKRIYKSGNSPFHGSSYDEYVDVPEYFIVFPTKETRNFFNLKKNAIERLFALHVDSDKVNDYLSTHQNEKIDEGFLKNLIEYLNEQTTSNH